MVSRVLHLLHVFPHAVEHAAQGFDLLGREPGGEIALVLFNAPDDRLVLGRAALGQADALELCA